MDAPTARWLFALVCSLGCGSSPAAPDAATTGAQDGSIDGGSIDVAAPPDAGGAAASDGATGVEARPADAADQTVCGFVMPNPASLGLPNPAAYDTSVAGVVTDKVSGLMWERRLTGHMAASTGCSLNLTGLEECPLRYATAYCAGSRLGGFDDWRLPSVLELISLLDFTVSKPQIDNAAFPETPPEAFWSSTREANGRLDFAHQVSFDNGNERTAFIDEPHRVRCVRSAVPPRCARASARFQVMGEVVADSLTGLTWRRTPPGEMAFSAATSYCAGLGGGFRLPSVKELYTLLDFSKSASTGATIERPTFQGPEHSYWTSSVYLTEYMSAWVINFQDVGPAIADFFNTTINVRCVR